MGCWHHLVSIKVKKVVFVNKDRGTRMMQICLLIQDWPPVPVYSTVHKFVKLVSYMWAIKTPAYSFCYFIFRLLGIFWKCARIGKLVIALHSVFHEVISSHKIILILCTDVALNWTYCFFSSGERKSPWVACCCVIMAFSILFLQ